MKQAAKFHYLLFLLAAGLLAMMATWNIQNYATPTTQAWSPEAGILPGSDREAFWPDTVVDTTGMIHTVWHDVYWDGHGSPVYYVRGQFNETGTAINWLPPISLTDLTDITPNDGTAKVAVDPNGTVHVVFMSQDNMITYLYSPDRGVSWAAERFAIPDKGWSLAIDVDDLGNPYVTWSSGVDPGHAWYTFRLAPGQWAAPMLLSSGFLVRNNSIAATVLDGQPYVHVFYDYKTHSKEDFYVLYSRGTPASFSPALNFSANYAGLPRADTTTISADETVPGRLYVGFIYGWFDDGNGSYQLYFSTSVDNGITWPGFAPLSIGPNIWPGMAAIVGYNNIAHIITEEKYWNGNKIENFLIWYRSYNTTNGQYSENVQISANNEKGALPSLGGYGPGKIAVWTVNNTEYVKYNFDPLEPGSIAEPSPTPTITPTATATPTPVATPTPTFTPTPSPTPIVASMEISATKGYTLTIQDPGTGTTDDTFSIMFPISSVPISEPVKIIYTNAIIPVKEQPLPEHMGMLRDFMLTAQTISGVPVTTFAMSYTMDLVYTEQELTAAGIWDEETLNVAYWQDSEWHPMLPCDGCEHAPEENRFTIVADHFTDYAVMGKARVSVYLPIVQR